jgi:HEAT repeats
VTPLTDDIEQSCRTDAIDRCASEVVLELLDVEYIGRIDYLTLLTKLSDFANDFLETGRFQEIAEIYNTLYSTALKGNFTDESSSMVEYFFRSEAFISKLVEAMKLWGRHDRAGVLRLANLLRLYVINPLIDTLAEEQDSAIRRFLLTVLGSLGSDVIPEVTKRLNDERWYVVRNMIYLIRECGGPKQASCVRSFAKHKDRKVCIEAVKTLLHFNTPDALPIIKFYLRSDDLEMRNLAIRLAGSYKVKEALPFLTEILDRRDPFGKEAHCRISAVKALSEIGDPRALETLKKVYKARPLLFRSSHEDLMVEIFRNLHQFPAHAARPLVELGMKSRNREIKSISEQLTKRSEDGHQEGL